MEIYEIKDGNITYMNMIMKKAKEFIYEDVKYIEFLNYQEHRFVVMEKISDNQCIKITDKDLMKKIIDANFQKASNIIV
jgi:hypothetical protein